MQSDLNNVFPSLYYIQLTEGCISFKCNHRQCRSSQRFIYSSETNESLREKANAFALNHKSNNLLCSNFPPTLYDFTIFENVLIFNDFLADYIHQKTFRNTKKIIEILSNSNSYPFLFSYDLNEIDFYSIHPPQELIKDFILAEKSNPKALDFLRQSHNNMVNQLISNIKAQNNSLFHLRAVYISFLFYTLFSKDQKLLLSLIKHTMSLLPDAHLLLSDMISKSPSFISELNAIVQDALSNYISNNSKKMNSTIWDTAKFIHFILVPANNKSFKPIPYRSFANKDLSKNFMAKIELRRFITNRPTFLYTSSVINLIKKSKLLPDGNIVTTVRHNNFPLLQVNSSFRFDDFINDETPDDSYGIEEEDSEIEEEEEEEASSDEESSNDSNSSSSSSESEYDDDECFHIDLLPRHSRLRHISLRIRNSNTNTNTNINVSANGNLNIRSNESRSDQTPNLPSNSHNRSDDIDDDYDDDLGFESMSDEYDGHPRIGHLNINVRRNHLLDDTLVALLTADQKELMGRVKVRFKGEEAYDAGGVSREFFTLVTSTLFSPDYGMFELINNKFYWFRNNSDNGDLSRYFKLLGAFIGIAINNKVILPIRFPLLMYKKLLNYKNSRFDISDFSEVDPSVAQSLHSLLESKEKGENVEDAGLMFDFSYEYFDTVQTLELIENGSNIPVTNYNVKEYIQKVIDWKLNKSIENQFQAFKDGYNMNCNTPIMKLFAPVELDELVSGLEKLDWEAFKKSVNYSGYTKNSQTIKFLWQIMDREWNEKQKKDFLYFITGTRTAPVGGLGQLKITIEKENNSNQLPKTHTCFNELILPDYKNIHILRNKLNICLENCEGFGLV